MSERTNTREEAIDFLLLKEKICFVAHKRHDTGIPDSLGDQLIRAALRMSFLMGKHDPEGRKKVSDEARSLLLQVA